MPKEDQPYIGIDLGGTNVAAAVCIGDKVLSRDKTKTKADQGADAVIKRIEKVVDNVIDTARVSRDDIAGLGIGAPGAINVKKGTVIEAVNLGWSNYPLGDILQKRVKIPVVVDNDVNVGAWGAYKFGAGQGHKSMLAIFIGTGIGGGLIIDGELYHGHYFTAGEIGHTVVNAGGSLGRNTLENLASRTSIANLLAQLIHSSHESVISELTDGDLTRIRSKVISQAVQRNDELTKRVLADAARVIGISIANTVTLLSLSCVVVGGGLTEALSKTWIQQIRQSFEEHVFPPEIKKCRIVASTLGDDAGVVGAAMLARDRLGANP